MKRLMIAAGGTGGHIFPALAVAAQLTDQEIEIKWLGTAHGLEQQLVAPHYPLLNLSVRALRGQGWRQKLMALRSLWRALWQARRYIKRDRPSALLAMGGYVSAPAVIAARLCGCPVIIHEQNAKAGLTNRVLARLATVCLQGFPDAFKAALQAKTVGNPVRADIAQLPAPVVRYASRTGPLRILVLGGSQGALAFNEHLPGILIQAGGDQHWQVRHQVGQKALGSVQAQYEQAGMMADVSPFFSDMAEQYAWADLVVARAGASTVAEISAAGCASVLIPYPYAVDDHQFFNAHCLAVVNAAQLFRQNDAGWQQLGDYLQAVTRADLAAAATQAKTCAHPQATHDIAAICLQMMASESPAL